jgi:hypothetical protein
VLALENLKDPVISDKSCHYLKGGSDTPCNNNGKCSNLGQCTCVWNWNGAVDCGTCTTGMKGPDCKILYVGTPGTKAFITGKGDYMGFNGYQISLDEIYGVFKVFEDSSSNYTFRCYCMEYQIHLDKLRNKLCHNVH